jgi:type II secretory ATPase GspE/PulE/Tfp pilus assembly ATPase PilB-like protein
LITGAAKSHVLQDAAVRGGMTTLRADAARKVLAGVTTVEELIRETKGDIACDEGAVMSTVD